MRPLYETQADRDAEIEIGEMVVQAWGCDHAVKLSPAYGLDWALVLVSPIPVIVGFVEIKNRDLTFGVPGGYYISLLKAKAARVLTATTGLPCYLVVQFSDGGVRWADFAITVKARLVEHGRTDRGDPYDIEPCVAIPWEVFSEL